MGNCRKADRLNPTGYFENTAVKNLLIKKCGALVKEGRLSPKVKGFRHSMEAILKREGYEGGPWLVKHSALYYPVWHEFDPIFVSPMRRIKDMAASQRRSPGMLADIPAHIAAMTEAGSFMVDMDKVVDGDYSELSQAFERCGLVFDASKAGALIRREYWHREVS